MSDFERIDTILARWLAKAELLEEQGSVQAAVQASQLRTCAAELEPLAGAGEEEPRPEPEPVAVSWRERIWSVPANTLLSVPEIAEALGRSESWTYKRTMPAARDPLPVSKMGSSVVARAGDLRAWIESRTTAATS